MIKIISETNHVQLFCDLHGHSTNKNIFMYGWSGPNREIEEIRSNNLAKMFPVLMSLRNRYFSFNGCHFKMEASKENTARMVAFR